MSTNGFVGIREDDGRIGQRLREFNWQRRANLWARKMGPRLVEEIKREAPVGEGDTAGRLRDATGYSVRSSPGKIEMTFHAEGVPYAPFVIHATGAHTIRPRTGRVLHWVTGGGTDQFAPYVRHPGTSGNDYVGRAVRRMNSEMASTFAAAVREI